MATILPGVGRTLNAIYTVPNNFTASLSRWHVEVSRTPGTAGAIKEAVISLFVRTPNEVWNSIQTTGQRSDSGRFNHNVNWYDLFTAKTDIRIQVQALANNVSIAAGMEFILEELV